MAEQQAATSEVQQPLSPQPAAAPSSLPAYRALTRSARIPSCVLDRNDIRRLYRELSVPAQEAIDRQISAWERPPGTPPSHWKQVTEQARQIGKLLVLVEGKGGQQIIGASEEVLGEDGLPDVISAVTFDSSLPFENFAKQKPTDWFRLRLDLTEPPSLGAYNPWEEATPNKSTWEVTGANDTWVTGVFESTMSFFRARQRHRAWLHSATTFTLGNYLLAFPIAFWIAYRAETWFRPVLSGAPTALRVMMYVYIFILSVILFRFVAWSVRWILPLVELQGAITWRTRALVTTVVVGLFGSLLYDVLKAAF